MVKKRKKYLLLLFLCSFLFLFPSMVSAVKGEALAVKPIYPKNQVGGETGYLQLKVSPGEEQDIELEIQNSSKEKIRVAITALQAATSDAGVITYNEDKEVDESTKYPFKDLVTLEKNELDIPGSKTEKVKLHLKVPKESFSGKLIGGITVSEKRDLTADEKKQSIVNEFQYAIPIVLFENEDKVEPKIELVDIAPGLRNFSPYIEATLQNTAPINISKMVIDGKIVNRKTEKTLISRKEVNYQMAPTSSFNFGFDLQNAAIVPGDYAVDFTIVADGKTFELKKHLLFQKLRLMR